MSKIDSVKVFMDVSEKQRQYANVVIDGVDYKVWLNSTRVSDEWDFGYGFPKHEIVPFFRKVIESEPWMKEHTVLVTILGRRPWERYTRKFEDFISDLEVQPL